MKKTPIIKLSDDATTGIKKLKMDVIKIKKWGKKKYKKWKVKKK